jgi:hypothetical protein
VNATRAARITAAAGTSLAQPLFPKRFRLKKSRQSLHVESPRHTFVHCGGFAPAAPRRARVLVSVPFSGLLLSEPVWITGLVGHYPANSLIHRRPVLWRPKALSEWTFQYLSPMAYYPQFPKVIRHRRVSCLRVTEPCAECSRHSDLHGLVEFHERRSPAGSTGFHARYNYGKSFHSSRIYGSLLREQQRLPLKHSNSKGISFRILLMRYPTSDPSAPHRAALFGSS